MILGAFFREGMPGTKEATVKLASGVEHTGIYVQFFVDEDFDSSGSVGLSRSIYWIVGEDAYLADVRRDDLVEVDGYDTAFKVIADSVPDGHGVSRVYLSQ